MQSTADQDGWVHAVLGVQMGQVPAGAQAGPQTAQGDGPPGAFPEPTQNWFTDAVKGIADKVAAVFSSTNPSSPEKSALVARLTKLTDPPGATKDQIDAFQKERTAATTALKEDAPAAPDLATATKAIDKLTGLIDACRRTKSVADLTATNPEAGKKATAAFGKFQKVLGDTPVTPEAMKKAADEKAAKRKILEDATKAYTDAKALPEGHGKKAAMKKASGEFKAAKAGYDKADAYEEAMVGQSSLSGALSSGPLSGKTEGGFKDPAITEKLIEAYSKDARMADAAVGAAATAKFPNTIADNVGPMIDKAKGGFADKTGQKFVNPEFNEKYGQDLLKQAGQLGPKYIDKLPDYLASGQQFETDPMGTNGQTSWNGFAQARSRNLASNMIKPDGSIDTETDGAKNAVGNTLFHPDAMKNPTPGLTDNVMKTMDMLKDPTTGPQASTVLKGVTAPTNPAGKALVQGSLGKGASDPVDDTGARTAVLTSMFQPLDQGPVGSCFVTGPARKMRETQPVEVMKSYAELASKGTYTPKVGPALPAITNLPADEDPLMRSFEYTAATAGARNADSIERGKLSGDVAQGTALLKDAATKGVASKDKDKTWATKQAKLAKDVADAFTFTYDATAEIGSSSDGSSSKGRYVVVYGTKDIKTKADFQAAMLEVALQSLGMTAGSDDAKEVTKIVNSDAFAAKVCPRKGEAPWELIGGGFGEGTIQSLTGNKVTRSNMVGPAGNPKPPEGERTTQVLSGFLNAFRGDPAEMATMDTSGQHSFNMLPNNPSLAALKGTDDADTAKKVKANLLDKGNAMKDTELDADRAGGLFDEAIKKETKGITDPALQKLVDDGVTRYRPAAAVKPKALTEAVESALEAYHDKSAEAQTGTWKADQATKGKAVTPAEEAKHKADLKKAWDAAAATAAKNGLMKDLGAPEFVIADSNWGSALNHTYFVIAPDPTTGEPLMWMKTEPPGTLAPAGRDWIDRSWQTLK